MTELDFVGFRKSPKTPTDKSIFDSAFEVSSSLSRESAFQLFSSAKGLSSWLTEVEKFECRVGGKLQSLDLSGRESVANCIALQLGSSVTLISEWFGELNLELQGTNATPTIQIRVHCLTDDAEALKAFFNTATNRLATLVNS